VQEGECQVILGVAKAVCAPWLIDKRSKIELLDLVSGTLTRVPDDTVKSPVGEAVLLSVGDDFAVVQVGRNATEFAYFIIGDRTNWQLLPFRELNRVRSEWIVSVIEIEK
jgi:hypothetical protein